MKTHTLLTLLFAFTAAAADHGPHLVQFNTKIVSVPLDASALRDAGLTLDSPDALSNLGIISAEKAAAVLLKLEKMPGHSLLLAPSFATKSGTRATGESTREFIYPTEFVPAKLSTEAGDKRVQLSPGQVIAAAPAIPRSFEMRRTGFRLEIEPIIGADGTTLELNLAPELVTFEGFMNYGSPIKAVAADKDGKLSESILTENQVFQPIFSIIKTTTGVTLTSGHVLVLGHGGSGQLPSASTKPDLTKIADPSAKSTHAVFFFIQAKVIGP
jgi:general secretion pathway protein D